MVCELDLGENPPDHSYFGDFRKRLCTKNLMTIFNRVRKELKSMDLIREVFTFVDASHLVSKLTTWDDRDRAVNAGLEKFNNKTAEKIAVDNGHFGCKGVTSFGMVIKNTPRLICRVV